jgi:type IV pilus assembly protein PilM
MMSVFRRNRSVVGLDVGSSSVKLVHLLHGNAKPQVLSCQEQVVIAGDGGDDKGVVEAIRQAFHQAGLKPGHGEAVVTSVNGAGTAIKQVEFPLLTDAELKSSIKWQAGKRLPFGPEEAIVDYQVLGRDEAAQKMFVLLAAVTRDHLAEHLQILRNAGIEPLVIDLSPLALANALMGTRELEKEKAVVMLDLGAAKTILIVFSPGELFFTRDISISGRQFTEEIGKHLKIDDREAERIKWEGEADQLLEVLKGPLDQLIFEIRRSLTYYENRRGQRGFEKLYLSGGGARLVRLAEHLHSSLGVPVEEIDPLQDLKGENSPKTACDRASRFTLAVGLALRNTGVKNV